MSDVLVVGGGVIGLCTAYYAGLRGHRVTVVDREPEGYAGCSHGNAGMVVPSHFVPLAAPGMVALGLRWMWNPRSPFYIQPRLDWDLLRWGWRFWKASTPQHVNRAAPVLRDLHLASRAAFAEFAAAGDAEFGLTEKGLLMLCKTARAHEEEADAAEKARALGLPAEVLTADAARQLDPEIEMSIVGAVHYPKDCHLDPSRFLAALRARIFAQGGRILWGREVTHWEREGDRIRAAGTWDEDLTADEFVLCGGSWSAAVGRDLGLSIPLQAGKGYSLTLPEPPQQPRLCSILTEARIAVTPMGAQLRIGGTMELAGLNETVNPARVQGIIEAVPRYFPRFAPRHFAGVAPWRGLRPCSPDGMPYVGRTRRWRNLGVATGHAMMGLSLGPVTGQVMADLLSGVRPSFDLSLLSPERFG